jgi:hypothetical protein
MPFNLSEELGISGLKNAVFARQSTHFVQRMSEIRSCCKRVLKTNSQSLFVPADKENGHWN